MNIEISKEGANGQGDGDGEEGICTSIYSAKGLQSVPQFLDFWGAGERTMK